LFGGSCGEPDPEGESIGAPEVWENIREGESGPNMLDLGLPCCESGRMERRLIHDPLEDTESLAFSAIGRFVRSVCRMKDCRLLVLFGGVIWLLVDSGGRDVMGG